MLPASRVRPPSPSQLATLHATAAVAARDTSCPSCHDKWPDAAPRTRAGATADGRLPQPACGAAPEASRLSAPPFFVAEWPRRLLADKAPWGMRMSGKTEKQGLQVLRSYMRNLSQPLRCSYATCAVVGSAGSLRDADLGAAIDAHDAVVRVNAAPVTRHERAVGSRTTWRVHNSEKPWFMASLGAPELQVAVCHMRWIGACQHQAFSGVYADGAVLVNPVFYSQLWSLLGRPASKQSPSTGLLAIALALTVCGRVSLYGFTAPGEPHRPCERHYWECPAWADTVRYQDPSYAFHGWDHEARLRRAWVEAGLVVDGALAYGPGAAGAAAVRRAAALPAGNASRATATSGPAARRRRRRHKAPYTAA